VTWRVPVIIAGFALLAWFGFEIGWAGNDMSIPRVAGPDTLTHGKVQGKRIDGRAWSLDYDTATFSADASQATIQHVRDGRIHRAGKSDVLMSADNVTVNTLTHDFTVNGPVTFREKQSSGETRTFTTIGARYIGATRLLNLDHSATITQGDAKFVVDKATVDFRTGDVTLGKIEGTKPGTNT
jgi:hypothetical protein